MPYGRIWVEPDGSTKITTFANPNDESVVGTVAETLTTDGRVHPMATYTDYATLEDLKAAVDQLPKRPDPPDPDQDLQDSIASATTVAQLKVVLASTLRRLRGR